MIINGTPALFKVGIKEILFGTVWQPAAKDPSFGILYVILTSIVGTCLLYTSTQYIERKNRELTTSSPSC